MFRMWGMVSHDIMCNSRPADQQTKRHLMTQSYIGIVIVVTSYYSYINIGIVIVVTSNVFSSLWSDTTVHYLLP